MWNLSRTPSLTGLEFEDINHLHDLRDLQAGISLQELDFGDGMRSKAVFESLQPLTALDGLRSLKFRAKRIDDRLIEPLVELTGLQKLTFPTNIVHDSPGRLATVQAPCPRVMVANIEKSGTWHLDYRGERHWPDVAVRARQQRHPRLGRQQPI